ncbi:carbohydrate kinase family protein [Candidatus Acetothermia bacterium]|nr:carbohydrate kinase family protein [Candidatus Acetothermia bacterium]
MNKIIVLGDLNLDVLVHLPGMLPADGEMRTIVLTAPGGSAGNFARAAAREGAAVVFIGCVGDDLVGDLLIRSLQEEGINTQVRRVDIPTGTVVSLVNKEGKTMLCSRGANEGLDPAWCEEDLFGAADHLHISGYSFLSPVQSKAAQRAIYLARCCGITISIDPPPANLIESFGLSRFLAEITAAEMIFPNLAEGRILSGEAKAEKVVAGLAETFPVGALTLAERGSLAWKGEERDHYRGRMIDASDSTGAGDGFAAGFVVSYLHNRDLTTANQRGNEVAVRILKEKARVITGAKFE